MNAHLSHFPRMHRFHRAVPVAMLAVLLALSGLLVASPGRASADTSGNPTIAFGSSSTFSLSVTSLNGSYTVTAGSIVPGGSVAVSGNGFSAGESVSLTLSGQTAAFATVQADGTGVVNATVTIPASTAPGAYTVTATGALSGHSATASLNISVLGSVLSVVSSSVNAGGSLVASGAGFWPHEAITFTFNGTAVTPAAAVTTDGTGAFAGASLTIPAATASGSYTLMAQGASSGLSALITVSVNSLSLGVSAITGNTATITGSGFAPGELVNVTLAGQVGVLATLQADTTGAVNGTVTLPSALAAGSYTLIATGLSSGNSASTPLVATPVTVAAPAAAPTITLGSVAVAGGATVTVTGSGFAAHEVVSLGLVGPLPLCTDCSASLADEVSLLGTVTADASGAFSTSVTIPATLSAGLYSVEALGASSGDSAAMSIIVNSAEPFQFLSLGW